MRVDLEEWEARNWVDRLEGTGLRVGGRYAAKGLRRESRVEKRVGGRASPEGQVCPHTFLLRQNAGHWEHALVTNGPMVKDQK